MLDKTAPRLAFRDPIARGDRVVTLRRGPKWRKTLEDDGRDQVVVLDAEGEVVGPGRIVMMAYLPFVQIPPEWVRPRTLASALLAMSAAYPGFDRGEYVTVLWVEVEP